MALASIAFITISYLAGLTTGYARGVFLIDWFCLSTLLTGYRALAKKLYLRYKAQPETGVQKKQVLIWGAGDCGELCLRFLRKETQTSYEVIGFIDDNPKKRSKRLGGIKVLGDRHHLETISQLYKVKEVVIAVANTSGHELQRMCKICRAAGLKPQVFFIKAEIKGEEFSPAPEQKNVIPANDYVLPQMGEQRIFIKNLESRLSKSRISFEEPRGLVQNEGGKSMRAVILAGGKGVRLAPVTQVIPKPLVPLGGKPILEIVIRQLKNHGFRHITLAVGYMADLIQAYFGDGGKFGVQIDYSFESEPLGTAGPLALIDGLDETFLVMNADVLTDLNYRTLVDYHRSHGAIATVSAYERQVTIDLGVIIKDGGCRIRDYVEKPSYTHLVSMGVYVFEPAILEYISTATFSSSRPGTGEVNWQTKSKPAGYLDFPDLVKQLFSLDQLVNFYPFDGYWLDIGRHEDYAGPMKTLAISNISSAI